MLFNVYSKRWNDNEEYKQIYPTNAVVHIPDYDKKACIT